MEINKENLKKLLERIKLFSSCPPDNENDFLSDKKEIRKCLNEIADMFDIKLEVEMQYVEDIEWGTEDEELLKTLPSYIEIPEDEDPIEYLEDKYGVEVWSYS